MVTKNKIDFISHNFLGLILFPILFLHFLHYFLFITLVILITFIYEFLRQLNFFRLTQQLNIALLWREDCNVISVDWEAGSLTAGYYVIQARVPEVGEDISKLINFLLSQTPLRSKDFHIIGHSLGAHIAGFAGKYMNGSIGRITGM